VFAGVGEPDRGSRNEVDDGGGDEYLSGNGEIGDALCEVDGDPADVCAGCTVRGR
jgi:hypothetical protein